MTIHYTGVPNRFGFADWQRGKGDDSTWAGGMCACVHALIHHFCGPVLKGSRPGSGPWGWGPLHHTLHPNADIDRWYLPPRNGGRGLLKIKQTVEEEKHTLVDYIKDSQEQALMQIKHWNLLNVQERKHEYWNNVMKTRTKCWQGKVLCSQFQIYR